MNHKGYKNRKRATLTVYTKEHPARICTYEGCTQNRIKNKISVISRHGGDTHWKRSYITPFNKHISLSREVHPDHHNPDEIVITQRRGEVPEVKGQ